MSIIVFAYLVIIIIGFNSNLLVAHLNVNFKNDIYGVKMMFILWAIFDIHIKWMNGWSDKGFN